MNIQIEVQQQEQVAVRDGHFICDFGEGQFAGSLYLCFPNDVPRIIVAEDSGTGYEIDLKSVLIALKSAIEAPASERTGLPVLGAPAQWQTNELRESLSPGTPTLDRQQEAQDMIEHVRIDKPEIGDGHPNTVARLLHQTQTIELAESLIPNVKGLISEVLERRPTKLMQSKIQEIVNTITLIEQHKTEGDAEAEEIRDPENA